MDGIDRVEGLVEEKYLSIQMVNGRPAVCYKDVPIWSTAVGLDELDIFLYDPTKYREQGEEEEPYSLFCVDGYGDIYTYGNWETLEQAKAWLEKPRRLY